jgi:hypothetical protein
MVQMYHDLLFKGLNFYKNPLVSSIFIGMSNDIGGHFMDRQLQLPEGFPRKRSAGVAFAEVADKPACPGKIFQLGPNLYSVYRLRHGGVKVFLLGV